MPTQPQPSPDDSRSVDECSCPWTSRTPMTVGISSPSQVPCSSLLFPSRSHCLAPNPCSSWHPSPRIYQLLLPPMLSSDSTSPLLRTTSSWSSPIAQFGSAPPSWTNYSISYSATSKIDGCLEFHGAPCTDPEIWHLIHNWHAPLRKINNNLGLRPFMPSMTHILIKPLHFVLVFLFSLLKTWTSTLT